MLHARNKRIEHVYFPESGIASVVANGETELEIGMIGREGMTGMSVVFDSNGRVPHDTYVQVAGSGYRLSEVACRRQWMRAPACLKTSLRSATRLHDPDQARHCPGQRSSQD